MGKGRPCKRDGCPNTVSQWARSDKDFGDDRVCILARAKLREAKSAGGPRLHTQAEKARAKTNGNGDVSWYGAGGEIRAWHGASRNQVEMRNAYLHQKAVFMFCDCHMILRADTERELTIERRRHERDVCICRHRAEEWSVKALKGMTPTQ